MRRLIFILLLLLPYPTLAQDKIVRLSAPEMLTATGLLAYILPRFSLKTQVRVELVEPDRADLVLGQDGPALFQGIGQIWHMDVRNPDDPATAKLAGWLTSDVGKRAVTGFAPDGEPLFRPPENVQSQSVAITLDGDAALGLRVSRQHCRRCHVVDDDKRIVGIGSTPSFAVLRSLADWKDRFSAFYALNPHPSFTIIADVTQPFPADSPPTIVPIKMTLDEVEAVLAYVAELPAADLGAPLVHQ